MARYGKNTVELERRILSPCNFWANWCLPKWNTWIIATN